MDEIKERGESHAEVKRSHPFQKYKTLAIKKERKYNHVEETPYVYVPRSDHGGRLG